MAAATRYAVVYFTYAPDEQQSVRALKAWKSLLEDMAKASDVDQERMDVYITGYAPTESAVLLNASDASHKVKRRTIVSENKGKTSYLQALNAEMIKLNDPLLETYDAVILVDHDIVFTNDDKDTSTLLKLGDRLLHGHAEYQIGTLAPMQLEDGRHAHKLTSGADSKARTTASGYIMADHDPWGVANGCVAVLPVILKSMWTRSLIGDISLSYWPDDVFLASRTIEYGRTIAIDKTCAVIHPKDEPLTKERLDADKITLLADLEAKRNKEKNRSIASIDNSPGDKPVTAPVAAPTVANLSDIEKKKQQQAKKEEERAKRAQQRKEKAARENERLKNFF